jgi:hypothetical protein
MYRRWPQSIVIAACLASVSCLDGRLAGAADDDPRVLDGLWTGSWGLMIDADGTVHQPVVAELLVNGDHVEMAGFPDVNRLAGTIRIDVAGKKVSIVPAAKTTDQSGKGIAYSYRLEGDKLVLEGAGKRSIELTRQAAAEVPLANADVEFVVATGFNDAGDLLVSKFRELRGRRADDRFLQPSDEKLKTKRAMIFVTEDAGLKKIALDDARRLIKQPTPVVIAYRHDEPAAVEPNPLYVLWKDGGSSSPDSEAVGRIISRTVRPGTLVFVLSAEENAPVP